MNTGKVLFICGSPNQTSMMHKISKQFTDFECWFSPYYGEGYIKFLSDAGLLNFTILGGEFKRKTQEYLNEYSLKIDEGGRNNSYDLVFTCSDLVMPKNILSSKIILVQEGMTDPENFMYKLVRKFGLPCYLAGTSATGLSDLYHKFCVASEGYKKFFISKGIKEEKIVVTGIPNFDNCISFINNDFPYNGFVLAATSDSRETFKYENRAAFIQKVVKIADGRQIIFKLHPNENVERAISEINLYAPGALVFSSGNTEHMVANCEVLITRYSTVAYVGLALGKEVYSEFDIDDLKKLLPIQNGGLSAFNISLTARQLLKLPKVDRPTKISAGRKQNLIPKRVNKI
jgi:hypothetical protein